MRFRSALTISTGESVFDRTLSVISAMLAYSKVFIVRLRSVWRVHEGVKFRRSLPALIAAHILSRKGNLTLPQSTLKIDAVSQGGCARRAPDDSQTTRTQCNACIVSEF